MEQKHKNSLKKILFFDTLDSTNKYANKLITDEVSEHGTVIWTKHQTHGKGQRNNTWSDTRDHSLLFSLILHNPVQVRKLFLLNKLIAINVVRALNQSLSAQVCSIKWPNDIILNNKKIGGILIENQIKGAYVPFSVVGIGINLLQQQFEESMPFATSIFNQTGIVLDMKKTLGEIVDSILNSIAQGINEEEVNSEYFSLLWKNGKSVKLYNADHNLAFHSDIISIDDNGNIEYLYDGKGLVSYYGAIKWMYEN